jgi:hypothetical protein
LSASWMTSPARPAAATCRAPRPSSASRYASGAANGRRPRSAKAWSTARPAPRARPACRPWRRGRPRDRQRRLDQRIHQRAVRQAEAVPQRLHRRAGLQRVLPGVPGDLPASRSRSAPSARVGQPVPGHRPPAAGTPIRARSARRASSRRRSSPAGPGGPAGWPVRGPGRGRTAPAQTRGYDVEHGHSPGHVVPAGVAQQRPVPDPQRQRRVQAAAGRCRRRAGAPARTPRPTRRAG